MIRPIKLTIHNIGPVSDIEYPFNKSLICFFGATRQGKTTATSTAINLLRGGAFPPDILRHETKEGFVKLDIEGGSITREFYVDPKDGLTKALEIVFLRDNSPITVPKPVAQLREIFGNPFLQDGDFLKRMGPTDRKQYFISLLNIDTGELDAEKKDLDDQNRMLEAKIAGYGDIDETPVLAIDTAPIKAEMESRRRVHGVQIEEWQKQLDGLRLEWQSGKRKELREAKNSLTIAESDFTDIEATIVRLRKELESAIDKRTKIDGSCQTLRTQVETLTAEVNALPDLTAQANELKAKIAKPLDLSDLEEKLKEAAAQEVRVSQYVENMRRVEQRKNDNDLLGLNKERGREIKLLKAKKLAQIAEDSGIKGLSFDEDGDFLFEGTANALISTSQHQRLGLALSQMYPDTAPIELLDRAESLGVDVFKIIEGAKERQSTILATIVGEKPALIPDDVGVFVVEGGKLKP
jgi:hypothetical protein